MKRQRSVVLGTIALFTTGCATMQQAPESVKEKLLVRVWVSTCPPAATCADWSPERRYQGALLHMDADQMTLLAWKEADPTLTIPLALVTELHLYRGRKASAEAAVGEAAKKGAFGAVAGAVLGAVAGAVFGGGVAEGAGSGAVSGAAWGAAAGAYEGIFAGVDHWEAVPVKSLYTLYCLTNEKADCIAEQEVMAAPVLPLAGDSGGVTTT